MRYYDEFFAIVESFEQHNIAYAVIGGAALAFYHRPRFTRDIDIFVKHHDLKKTETCLGDLNYFKSTDPHKFLNVDLILHRFLKTEESDYLIVDILVNNENEFNEIFKNAIKQEWKNGEVKIASKDDLIRLKRFRNSDQDKIDIKKLTTDE
jgi:hypothetical protein